MVFIQCYQTGNIISAVRFRYLNSSNRIGDGGNSSFPSGIPNSSNDGCFFIIYCGGFLFTIPSATYTCWERKISSGCHSRNPLFDYPPPYIYCYTNGQLNLQAARNPSVQSNPRPSSLWGNVEISSSNSATR